MSDEYSVDEIRHSIHDGAVSSLTVVLTSTDGITFNEVQHHVQCDILDHNDELEVSDIRFNVNSSDGRQNISIEELMDILDSAVEALNGQGHAVELSMPQRLSESVISTSVTGTQYPDDRTVVGAND